MLDTGLETDYRKDCGMQEDLLMMKIAGGDQRSFDVLYDLWCRRIMAYAYRSLRDVQEAEDVVQETFLQVYRAAPSYRCEGKFGAFVLRIAGNLVRMRFRGAPKPDSLSDILDDEEAHPESLRHSPEEGMLHEIDMEALLRRLPERQREALILVASGATYSEGASAMGVTADAFAQLVLRARRLLNKMKSARTRD
jgi:RNA polymerase sigma factor, sigma-70 family